MFGCYLTALDDHRTRAARSAARESNHYMTSREMYRQLNHIQGLVPLESRAHFQIETILFRASAMLRGNRRMVLKPEDGPLPLEVPSSEPSGIQKLSSPTGYSVGVAANAEKGTLSQTPSRPPNLGFGSPRHPPNANITTGGGASGVVYYQGKVSGDSRPLPAYSCQDVCHGRTAQVCFLVLLVSIFLKIRPGRR